MTQTKRPMIEAAIARGRLSRQLTLDFITTYIAEHGWAPTMREIAVAMDCELTTAHSRVHRLVAEGRLESGGGPRQLRVMGSVGQGLPAPENRS